MASELLVFIGGTYAGAARAQPPERGRLPVAFRYDDAYIARHRRTPLSVGVPVVAADFEIGDWLDGLLPDDNSVRDDWAGREDADGSDAVSLLATRIGLDCAGAVQFCEPGRESTVTARDSGVEWLTETEIADWIREAKAGRRWSHIGSHGRYSLGGYQTKIALHSDGERWGSPYGQLPTTHILKPGVDPSPSLRYDDSDLMEHLSMTAAGHIGLDAAATHMQRFGSERVLVVERYDRVHDDAGLRRIHQEDLCQALGKAPAEKYQSLGGPTPADITELIRDEVVTRARTVRRFVDALIFNWAIAATDAHAKNYSLLLQDDVVSLAPLYDIMSYLPYRAGTQVGSIKTAMKVGRDYRLSSADRAGAWERAAGRLGVDAGETADRAEDILRRCPDAIDAAIDGLSDADRASPRVAVLSREIHDRRNKTLGAFRSPYPSASTSQQAPSGTRPGPSRRPPQPPVRASQPVSVVCGASIGPGRTEDIAPSVRDT